MKNVAVQIVTYNSEDEILECLEAIKLQSYSLSDIVVLDNRSSDNTVKEIKNSSYYKEIKLLENRENKGFAGGHNQAFRLSDSDYVLVLNPDVRLHPDYVYQLVQTMDKNLRVGAATGKLYRGHGNQVIDSTGLIIKKNRRAFDRGAGEVDRGQYDLDTDIFGVSGAAALYRREMIKDVSINGEFFDDTYFAYKEDVDAAWRSRLFGWKAVFVPKATAIHKRGWQGERKRKEIALKIRKHSYINRYYTILKNDSILYFLLHLPFTLFYEVLSIGYAVVLEREVISAWKEFKRNYPDMIGKRTKIINKQKVKNSEIFNYFKGIW